jgi:hypothetical protein
MTAIDLIERPRIAGLDHMLEAWRADNTKDRMVGFELRDKGDVHAEMCPNRGQRLLDQLAFPRFVPVSVCLIGSTSFLIGSMSLAPWFRSLAARFAHGAVRGHSAGFNHNASGFI